MSSCRIQFALRRESQVQHYLPEWGHSPQLSPYWMIRIQKIPIIVRQMTVKSHQHPSRKGRGPSPFFFTSAGRTFLDDCKVVYVGSGNN